MTNKKLCVIGSGEDFSAFAYNSKIKITYRSDSCFRLKTLDGNFANPKLNKTIKIYGDNCLPLCNFFVVSENGKQKIKGGE